MKVIKKYFKDLSEKQIKQLEELENLYTDWNDKINVISRKDIENLYLHHVLHSLSVAKYINFASGTSILDVGTGGGFPGVPLAILFPEVKFLLLDSIRKKIKVTGNVAEELGLNNVEVIHSRVEDEKRKFHFIVSRAVMPLPDLVKRSSKNILTEQINSIPNGIICLKGGDLSEEVSPFKKVVDLTSLSSYFDEDFFETKKLVYLPVN